MELTANLVVWPQVKAPFQFQRKEPTFFATVAHRRPSPPAIAPRPPPSIPQKRKSPDDSLKEPPAASRKPSPAPIINGFQRPSTPKSAPDFQASNNVEVVISSPSAQRKTIKEGKAAVKGPIGISEEFFPLDVEENARAAQRRYPTARAAVRSAVPLVIARKPLRPMSLAPSRFLRQMQIQKLKRIGGEDLSFDVDDEKLAVLSANFGFIDEYKLQEGVTPVPSEFIAGCDCNGPCDEFSCDCLNEELNSDRKIVPYHVVHGRRVLRPDFLKRKSLISECSSKCSCQGRQCWNHVVQQGRSVRLEIFDTGERGFGSVTPAFAHPRPILTFLTRSPITQPCHHRSIHRPLPRGSNHSQGGRCPGDGRRTGTVLSFQSGLARRRRRRHLRRRRAKVRLSYSLHEPLLQSKLQDYPRDNN